MIEALTLGFRSALTPRSIFVAAAAVIALGATNTHGEPTAQDNGPSPRQGKPESALEPKRTAKDLVQLATSSNDVPAAVRVVQDRIYK